MRETAGSYRGALHVIAGVMAISALLPILVRPPRPRDTAINKMVPHASTKELPTFGSRVAAAKPHRAL
jgi:hypothetical protein